VTANVDSQCLLATGRLGAVGAKDKFKNKAEEALGKAKEKLGEGTDDERMAAEGRGEQSKADVKQAGETVKDAFKD